MTVRGFDLDNDERHEDLTLLTYLFNPIVSNSIQALFGRPWFSRIWCIQEISLAEDALIL